jgi:hypothetical protein
MSDRLVDPGITLVLSGPFFTVKPSRTLRQNMHDAVESLVQTGEDLVRAQMRPGHGYLTGRAQGNIKGRSWRWSRTGVVWGRVGLGAGLERDDYIKSAWLERGSRQVKGVGRVKTKSGRGYKLSARSTRFKGYHMYRDAFAALNGRIPGVINDLARGLE